MKGVFAQNGYPESLFLCCVKRFLNCKFNPNVNVQAKDDKVETIFCIPYIGLPSVIFGRKLRVIFKKYYCIDVKIVFTSFKVKNYFSLKCRTPLPLLANVVYKFTCLRDANTIYIGKTSRHLATRIREHGHSTSTVHDHLLACQMCKSNFSHDVFKILDTGSCDFEITIKEAIHIKSTKPKLNKQLFSQGASFLLNIF